MCSYLGATLVRWLTTSRGLARLNISSLTEIPNSKIKHDKVLYFSSELLYVCGSLTIQVLFQEGLELLILFLHHLFLLVLSQLVQQYLHNTHISSEIAC